MGDGSGLRGRRGVKEDKGMGGGGATESQR